MDTPMLKQYREIKEKYKDYIVFFRLGDFYEMFFDDAHIAARELEIALTSRDPENRVPMAGVPYHAADQYIYKLISKGYKVVICEQVEDPKQAKGIVKREVVKIITPGTITEISALEEKKNNYLVCIYRENNDFGIAATDLMTGEFLTTEIHCAYPYQELLDELSKLEPRECLVNAGFLQDTFLNKAVNTNFNILLTFKENDYFQAESARELLMSQFSGNELEDIFKRPFATIASGACLNYLRETQRLSLSHINSIRYYERTEYMALDVTCRRNLELTQSLMDGKKQGSLLWVLDKTVTSMGGRTLRKWIEQPLIDIIKIKERQDAVEELYQNYFLRQELREQLKNLYDLERLTGKLVCGNLNARDLLAIKNTVKHFPKIKELLAGCRSKLLITLYNELDLLNDVYELLEKAINDDPPISVKEGGIIKDGFDSEVDRLRKASTEGKSWIAELERKERERTGIKSLKVGYNKVFGYYIEITKANLSLVPKDYIRKQTLANGERFITEELKEYESLIMGAEEKLLDLEYQIFCKIREDLITKITRLKKSAQVVSVLDALVSLAEVASSNNYVKPELTLNDEINIVEGRHPVVELTLKDEMFIPNDTHINCSDSMISIITGPNMAGKSTYMRQVALIVLMAQIGSFVPAKSAQIGIVDRIFTRIGASDNLASGQSTFMVEMTEVANILKHATPKSLLILDEIGRGTSTYDGLSIAWAVIEYIHKNIKAKTLFATHYHEITQLKKLKGVKNFKVMVKERGEDIIFLRKIVPGEADRSYGIEVAKLAGLPKSVILRAQEILKDLEQNDGARAREPQIAATKDTPFDDVQLNIESLKNEQVIRMIKELDINTITPLEALNLLYSIKQKII
ncbi:DNA mismatch repair protein MutS [Thermosediminibacter oceani]|uniref:DNA mismatch repair protein MutS n=1 Tax=Thermosediminibacter oceani (strain ATCC BAA-1034 / DSM 16646 / JW/IW-1228P) TaxID=555079 RepID=D9S3H0_THEOJ|nr:DNA mismatch repair protein MutS [Thermosediminibacter oceani]ADL07947.1 DNA mismatch repair protein MutS [Thermosediminibacter oceani DSM 16646]